ncbi:MAG: tripartite tricarboxylate transporter permease, partial [Desulfovibrio sp.]|nr:tripartite tricarboxylate transporter permease [Desulfovibrio sp.]
MDLLIHGIQHLFSDPANIFWFFMALFGGLIFGAVPGISVVTLGAIILPFTAYLSTSQALMIYSVMYCSGTFGGAVMAILFNIPGAAENAPTAFDGYPLTKRGKAGLAIGAAVTCSAIGGILSSLGMMFGTEAIARWAIHSFGPPEMFAIIFCGCVAASTVGASSILKGVISLLFGLLLSTVGQDPIGGISRYTFGSVGLSSGISFIPLLLGFFSITEVFSNMGKSLKLKLNLPKVQIEFPSLHAFWQHRFNILRSSLVGFFCGLLPGLGATLAAFLSYSEARRWSKTPENFGKGDLAGVIASETGNNAATGGAMVPMLALGIPGGSTTALMLSVFMMHGLEPGPLIMVEQKEMVGAAFTAMFIANCCILFLGYVTMRIVVNLLRIPNTYLMPIVFVLATIGTYALRNSAFDVAIMLAAGILGFFLRRGGYSPAG